MLEEAIENYLRAKVKALGGQTRKVKWLGHTSAPDRLVMLNGKHYLVELKKPGEVPRRLQLLEHDILRECGGFEVWWMDTKEKVDDFLKAITHAA